MLTKINAYLKYHPHPYSDAEGFDPVSNPSLGARKGRIKLRENPIKTKAAALMPGVCTKISIIRPIKNPRNNTQALERLKGSDKIKTTKR